MRRFAPTLLVAVLSAATAFPQVAVAQCDVANVANNKIVPGGQCGPFPCAADVTGLGTSCANLNAGMISGTKFGGGFPALDSPAGDIATTFQFTIQ